MRYLSLIGLLAIQEPIAAENLNTHLIAVTAKPTKTEVMLAEPIEVLYGMDLPEGLEVDLSGWKPQITQWGELTLWDFKVTRKANQTELLVHLIPFKLDNVEIPNLQIPVKGTLATAQAMAGETVKTIGTPVIMITVKDPTGGAASSAQMRDIKMPRKPPYFWEQPWVMALAAIFLAITLLGLLIVWRSRKKIFSGAKVSQGESLSAEDAFYQALSALENSGLLEAMRYREFYFALSDLFKKYLNRRFSLETESLTTSELLRLLHFQKENLNVTSFALRPLQENLEIADLAKFAKYQPTNSEQNQMIEVLKQFVQAHQPPPPQPAKEPEHAAGVKA